MPGRLTRSLRIEKAVIAIAVDVLFGGVSLAAQEAQTFKGQITASTCPGPDGQAMAQNKDETLAHYSTACVDKGAKYVLSKTANTAVYNLDDQSISETFAGQNVIVIGTLDERSGTIRISDMIRDLTPKIAQAKSIYIDCDACPRAMSKARVAALQERRDWKRFNVLQDRKNADLIFLFSANPYLGDYLTRDGPDKRPVSIEVTYMNVIDPHTGASLWNGSRRWGSWRVTGATKDLMDEFREELEADSSQVERMLLVSKHERHKASQDEGR